MPAISSWASLIEDLHAIRLLRVIDRVHMRNQHSRERLVKALEETLPATVEALAVHLEQCGECRACLDACPTGALDAPFQLDANRCISYLTIEHEGAIDPKIPEKTGNMVFGCDICQMVCPWNRFTSESIDEAFTPRPDVPRPSLIRELELNPEAFNRKFKNSPVKRAKRRGYLRNAAVTAGNSGDKSTIPALENAGKDAEPLVWEHVDWALKKLGQQ